ncbi:MAG TPA: hypothetical protein VHN38_00660 [Immundisolibacter sp.]|nr:hypothetical protein [Immundisolibacter sp.]
MLDGLGLARRQQQDTAPRATETVLGNAQAFLNGPPAGAQIR